MYERLLGLRNDLGLISEEYDPERGRLVGNFPQAFTHIGIVETAFTLSRDDLGDREEPPLAGDALERRAPAVLELEPGARDEIAHRARDEHLARARLRRRRARRC